MAKAPTSASRKRSPAKLAGTARIAEQQVAKAAISVKVTLDDIRPAIWRRILMPTDATLSDLHHAIQAAFGWMESHLHAFEINGVQYSDPFLELEDARDESRLRLDRIRKTMADRISYTYDFGDNWEHTVLFEKRLPPTLPPALPACVAGARNCPPEDCGGSPGYEELLEKLADPDDPAHAEFIEDHEDYDPEAFSVADADTRLAARSSRT